VADQLAADQTIPADLHQKLTGRIAMGRADADTSAQQGLSVRFDTGGRMCLKRPMPALMQHLQGNAPTASFFALFGEMIHQIAQTRLRTAWYNSSAKAKRLPTAACVLTLALCKRSLAQPWSLVFFEIPLSI
jgi:hypothetical protein